MALGRNLRKYGVLCTKLRLRPFSAALTGRTQRAPKPDMHSMERLELNLWLLLRYHMSLILQSCFFDQTGCQYPANGSIVLSQSVLGAVVAEWLSSWLAEQEDRGSIPGLATWIFRDWLSPASKSRYGWKIAKSTLILNTTNQPTTDRFRRNVNSSLY